MRAILIETDKGSIREVEFHGTLQHAYELLDCDLIEAVYLTDDILFVDEEGLLTPKTKAKGFFKWRTYHQPLAGRGLIVGKAEDFAPATLSIDEAVNMVTWLS